MNFGICEPHFDRLQINVPAVEIVAGTPMCAACKRGEPVRPEIELSERIKDSDLQPVRIKSRRQAHIDPRGMTMKEMSAIEAEAPRTRGARMEPEVAHPKEQRTQKVEPTVDQVSAEPQVSSPPPTSDSGPTIEAKVEEVEEKLSLDSRIRADCKIMLARAKRLNPGCDTDHYVERLEFQADHFIEIFRSMNADPEVTIKDRGDGMVRIARAGEREPEVDILPVNSRLEQHCRRALQAAIKIKPGKFRRYRPEGLGFSSEEYAATLSRLNADPTISFRIQGTIVYVTREPEETAPAETAIVTTEPREIIHCPPPQAPEPYSVTVVEIPPAPEADTISFIEADPPELKELAELTVRWFGSDVQKMTSVEFDDWCERYTSSDGPRLAEAVELHRKAKEITDRTLNAWASDVGVILELENAGNMQSLFEHVHTAIKEALASAPKVPIGTK